MVRDFGGYCVGVDLFMEYRQAPQGFHRAFSHALLPGIAVSCRPSTCQDEGPEKTLEGRLVVTNWSSQEPSVDRGGQVWPRAGLGHLKDTASASE
jgi:hypothetical protein